jgi:CheY-like chemotaxis protein
MLEGQTSSRSPRNRDERGAPESSRAGNGTGCVSPEILECNSHTSSTQPMNSHSAGSLLVVDDDADMLEVFPPALDSLGARITAVSSGQQALSLVAEHDYAAIILDVNMNVMDGFEAARRIREIERSHTTPIIFITDSAIAREESIIS